MSEYWVSKKRYFCKYCDVYIADDVPSRQHHENGLRHKGNVERFVRGLYKAGEKRKKDAEEEKREMRRIEQAASAAFAQDVGAGRAQITTTTSSSSSTPKKSGGISDYSTPESLGYTDPDIERALAEAERRRTQGVAGDWQMVEPTPTESPSGTGEESTQHAGDMQSAEGTSGDKRAVPDSAEEDEGRWKLRKKMTTPKVKEKETAGQEKQPSDGTAMPEDTKATTVPKWAPVKWKKAGEFTDTFVKEAPSPVKLEEATTPSVETASSGGSLFRKRKAPLGGGASSQGAKAFSLVRIHLVCTF
ncbi:hypothetical protein F5888DRAFT_1793674 [Russula emetica]|nr:hypothetical protein F5888DRAFT_1793674 [Russula emetica]